MGGMGKNGVQISVGLRGIDEEKTSLDYLKDKQIRPFF